MLRQGEVMIFKTTAIKGKKLNHLILAKGEVSTHCHKITEGDAELYGEDNGVLWLKVNSPTATLTHQEHNPQILKKGNYKIEIQKEYFPDGNKYVSD